MKTAKGISLALALLCFAGSADALIKALLPMKQIMADSNFVVEAKVVEVVPKQPGVLLSTTQSLKGDFKIAMLPINMQGDAECKKFGHTEKLLKRLAPDLPVILFINQKPNNSYIGFAYTNGTWFQVQHDPAKGPVWTLTHGEPYLRRTFKGTTAEMKTVVMDHVNMKPKTKLPAVNEKEPPGFGPEAGK